MPITLSALNLFPVKGLQGIALDHALCTDRGLQYDRRFMVVDAEGEFLTQRVHPRMATVWIEVRDGMLSLSAPDAGAVDVPLEPAGAATMRVRVWNSVCDAVPASAAATIAAAFGIARLAGYRFQFGRSSSTHSSAAQEES